MGVPSIAIIGTEGSGKTVLTTTLAKRLSTIDSRGVFLNPQGVATLKYVERIWQILQDGEWPPSTPPGKHFELRWKLEVVGELESEVRLIDAAGQDLRLLFGDDRISKLATLPDALRTVAEYCRAADIVLFLVNLKDFVGEGDSRQRTDNEAAIKGAMDYLSEDGNPRTFSVVFTQVDLYKDVAERSGGWSNIAKTAIPYVHGAYLRGGDVPIFPVSAVNATRVTVDESGVPLRVPVPGFGSDGLDDVIEWLTRSVRKVQSRSEGAELVENEASSVPPPFDGTPAMPEWVRECAWMGALLFENTPAMPEWVRKYAWIGVLLLAVLFLKSCLFSGGKTPGPEGGPTQPQPEIVELYERKNPGIFDDSVTSHGHVRNNGAAGNIIVTSVVTENGKEVDRGHRKFFLNAGETVRFEIELYGIYDVRKPYKVTTGTSVP